MVNTLILFHLLFYSCETMFCLVPYWDEKHKIKPFDRSIDFRTLTVDSNIYNKKKGDRSNDFLLFCNLENLLLIAFAGSLTKALYP